jgi:hypothetical protein
LVLLIAGGVLTAAAALRSAEYDEQYTLFLTAGTPRPVWPDHAINAGDVLALQTGRTSAMEIAQALRATDVHPPLYFWAVAAWRGLGLDGLFETRLLSVAFSLGSVALVGIIARQAGVPVALSMLLTAGCYGFAYTGGVARGFALAQLFTLGGIACVLRRGAGRSLAITLGGGLLLGAATLTNYLAVFPALGAVCGVMLMPARRFRLSAQHAGPALIGFILFLPADAWFYLAQRGSRDDQFPPFHLLATVERLARYSMANLFGGLPLYVADTARLPLSVALAVLAMALAALVMGGWQQIGRVGARRLLLLALLAPPLGLLGLGFAFDTMPVELRYLSLSVPFAGLLMAGALDSLSRPVAITLAGIILGVQAASLAGLMTRPETMQPARLTARAAAGLVGDGIVLLPAGNDGVGIVGAFAREAPAGLPLLIVGASSSIEAQVTGYRRVTLALMAQDADSRQTVLRLTRIFRPPVWRQVGAGFDTFSFERAERHAAGATR